MCVCLSCLVTMTLTRSMSATANMDVAFLVKKLFVLFCFLLQLTPASCLPSAVLRQRFVESQERQKSPLHRSYRTQRCTCTYLWYLPYKAGGSTPMQYPYLFYLFLFIYHVFYRYIIMLARKYLLTVIQIISLNYGCG